MHIHLLIVIQKRNRKVKPIPPSTIPKIHLKKILATWFNRREKRPNRYIIIDDLGTFTHINKLIEQIKSSHEEYNREYQRIPL